MPQCLNPYAKSLAAIFGECADIGRKKAIRKTSKNKYENSKWLLPSVEFIYKTTGDVKNAKIVKKVNVKSELTQIDLENAEDIKIIED